MASSETDSDMKPSYKYVANTSALNPHLLGDSNNTKLYFSSEKELFACPQCEKEKFENIVSKKTDFVISQSPKNVTNTSALNLHLLSDNKNTKLSQSSLKEQFACPQCEKEKFENVASKRIDLVISQSPKNVTNTSALNVNLLSDNSNTKLSQSSEKELFAWPQCKEEKIENISKKTDFIISQSPKNVTNTSALNLHLLSDNKNTKLSQSSEKKLFACPQCEKEKFENMVSKRIDFISQSPKTVTNTSALNLYLLSDGNDTKQFACPKCDLKFNQKYFLTLHMGIHTKKKPFICSECKEHFRIRSNLLNHLRTHIDNHPFACKECNKRFRYGYNLKCHMTTHKKAKPFGTRECNRRLGFTRNSKAHFQLHSGKKPFSCDLCDETFASMSAMKLHMQSHTVEKPFACPVCHKKMLYASHVSEHMRIHTGEKPFVCKQCNKRFRQMANFRSHMQTHSDERPYVCSECSKSFRQSATLIQHKRMHTDERPYVCSECNEGFRVRTLLKMHLRVHSGEKRFFCKECDGNYANKKALNRHMKRHC